jgi:hypothetical protein
MFGLHCFHRILFEIYVVYIWKVAGLRPDEVIEFFRFT